MSDVIMTMAATTEFYKRLTSFSKLEDITLGSKYTALPADWFLVMTDVKGSTKAIQEGRYKDVNVVGACSIIAVTNACPGLDFPFVFGGDGATLILPPSHVDAAVSALCYNRSWALEQFQLELRIAKIPMAKIYEDGFELAVAKYAISAENSIAVLSGSGVLHGEKLMKQLSSPYAVLESLGSGSMKGLECRWNPIKSKKYGILTLIIQSALENEDHFKIYREALSGIQSIVKDLKPIRAENLKAAFPPKQLYAEARARYKSRFAQWLWILAMMPLMAVLSILISTFRQGKSNGVTQYIDSLVRNTDHIKFDETLRMVLDVSKIECDQIQSLLESMRQKGQIVYGTHLSDEALMTCFIQSLSQHIHFVDGGSGGYAMAATQLKKQKAGQ